jgi:hypothetical protein
MDVTADNIVNQIAQAFLNKIDKQNLDPSFLENFVDTLVKKISPSSSTIPQQTSETKNDSTLVTSLKKTYTDLVKEPSFLEKFKIFANKTFGTNKDIDKKDFSIVDTDEQITPVTLVGLSPELKKELPQILKDAITLPTPVKTEKEREGLPGLLKGLGLPGIGVLKGGLAALGVVGGALALLYGLQTDSGFKGLAKIVGTNVLQLGLKTMFKGFVTKVPIVGAVVSLGFAASRLMKGDIVGAGLDTLSALANLLYLTGIGAPAAFAIITAVDALNAFLDYKAGGIGEGSQSKGNMIMGWIKGLGSWLGEKIINFPVIGRIIKAAQAFGTLNISEGLKQLALATPVGAFLNWILTDEERETISETISATDNWIKGIAGWLGKKIMKLPIFGNLITGVQELFAGNWKEGLINLSRTIPGVALIDAFFSKEGEEFSIVQKTFDWVKSLSSWLGETIMKLPIFSNLIYGLQNIFSGNWKNGLIDLSRTIPGVALIDAFFSKEGEDFSIAQKTFDWVKSLSSWLGETALNLPIIGGLIKGTQFMLDGNFKQGFREFFKASPVFSVLSWLVSSSEAQEQGTESNNINFVQKVRDWFIDKIKNVFSVFVNFGKNINEGKYGEAITGISKFVPGLHWITRLFGENNVVSAVNTTVKDVKTLFGFFDKIKNLLLRNILKMIPEKILGISVRSRVASMLGLDDSSITDDDMGNQEGPNTKFTSTKAQDPVPMASGGIVTSPTNAIIREAGPEAVIPLEKYFNSEDFTLNNSSLEKIVTNTGDTSTALKVLGSAITKLAIAIDRKISQANTTIVTSNNQQPSPPASTIAALNSDPIRQIRAQFAL